MYAVSANDYHACQRYSFTKRQWQAFPHPTVQTDNNISGAVLLNSVFWRKMRMLSKRQSCFDPQKKKWEVKATTSTRYQESTRLIVVKRKLYIAGGKVRGSPMAEYCNEKTNSWSVVKQKRIPANNLNAMKRGCISSSITFQLTVELELQTGA